MISDGLFKVLLSLGMLLTGCINTLSKKGQNNRHGTGWNGDDHTFTHPWFQTIIMFIGEAMCLVVLSFQRRNQNKENSESDDTQAKSKQPRVFQLIFIVPTIMDLLGTTFGGIGLVYVSASIWQMLRGSIIIFTGVLSWLFLHRKMLPYRWVSICVTMSGLVLVGISGMFTEQDSTGNAGSMLFGMCMVLLGQLVAAIQMVIEETFMKSKNFMPMHVVGMEGTFGVIIMAFVVLPILFFMPGDQISPLPYTVYENSFDAIIQMFTNAPLLIFGLLYLSSIAFYNFFGLSVTKHMTCVHRTLIDACRTVVVWTVDLFVHYAISSTYGEAWTKYSFIQVAGFALLVLGTILYNGIIHIPGFCYEENVCRPKADETQPLINEEKKEEA